ncbi:MAG: hypothetical protein CMM95_00815 [Rickettsiales bacterium]|nr:hypothetical protein [Rickettsiales bacterium]
MFFLRSFLFILVFSTISPNDLLGSKKKKFLATRYNEVNVRIGPGINHLKLYKILIKGYPLKIIEEFENWFKIQDYKKREGWVSKTQLNKESFAIITKLSSNLHKFPNSKSKILAIAEKEFIFKIIKCKKKWCNVSDTKEIKGWIKKKDLWGSIFDY